MSFRRDAVTETTTRTTEAGPVRWWLLALGLLAVLSLLSWGFISTVQRSTVADARAALSSAGLAQVSVDGARYRDVSLSGPAGDESGARATLEGLDLVYAVTYATTADTAEQAPPSPASQSPAPQSPAASAAPPAQPSAQPSATPGETPVVITGLPSLSGVQFETGSATLTASSAVLLDQAATAILAALEQHPTLLVAINGYTDDVGDPTANQVLSQQRADAVSAYLANRAVPALILSSTGYGEANPVATNDTADGRAANRRVELVSTER